MRDEMDMRLMDAHRRALGENVRRFIKSLAHVFDRLAARNYDAPWRRSIRQTCI